ncbi:DUF4304 domain-containing protein [Janthinobacterium sp. MDT1-19]|uniref:DUF4304 domain-containing protein n=1 Tax=Janthinobacterium sp. MDT1-19 TaxID=1259339 RepID=UPI003F29C83F
MKPKALIIANIEAFLLEPLTAAGFKFSPSQLTFKRTQNEFVQAIHFQANRHNEEHATGPTGKMRPWPLPKRKARIPGPAIFI